MVDEIGGIEMLVTKNANDSMSLAIKHISSKKVLETVDNHTNVGYEILSEPQVHDKNQWEKIGKYNTFMASF